jgi:NADPH:quinone reductase-like Zn-dependent oxidoreductase
MKAIQIRQFGSAENFELVDIPRPVPQAGEVCVRIMAAGFNPSDYKTRRGYVGGELPMVLGKDFSGIVESCDSGFSVGDEVYGYLGGKCSNGSYAEYVCVPKAFVAPKPFGLSFEEAAAIPIAGLTAYECSRKANSMLNQAVFISGGSGGVGSFLVEFCKSSGASPIVVTTGGQASSDYLIKHCGLQPEWLLNYRDYDASTLAAKAVAINHGKKFRHAFDLTGKGMKQVGCAVLDFEGTLSTIVPEDDDFTLRLWHRRFSPAFSKSASIHFVFLGARAIFGAEMDWEYYTARLCDMAKLFESHTIHLPKIQTIGELSVDTVQQAHALLEKGNVQGKIVMRI